MIKAVSIRCPTGLLVLALAGCAKAPGPPATAEAHEHVHVAPHGGTLVELGEHAFSVEFVRDSARGMLTAYVLDAHAENFVRIAAAAIELTMNAGGKSQPLTLKAIANPATGETVGDTSQFEVQADGLKVPGPSSGVIGTIDIRGAKFTNVSFLLPQ